MIIASACIYLHITINININDLLPKNSTLHLLLFLAKIKIVTRIITIIRALF
jgi:hypothetical protein